MIMLGQIDLSLAGLARHYSRGGFTPLELASLILEAIEQDGRAEMSNPIWIHVLTLDQIEKYTNLLVDMDPDQLPLYGVPFAIKDNIDLADIPTTAACADFSYTPAKSAFVVEQLIRAGAIPIGKTNMDQFATGLVGTRSPEPWGACHNAFNKDYIAGGSSSGSALAVAKGRVSFSLGTDTAGSGRVPASLNGIIGLKPSRGLLSTSGVVPACRSLDCVSIFARAIEDANTIFDIAARFDPDDPYARENSYANSKRYFGPPVKTVRLGVPDSSQLDFFGNLEAENLFGQAIQKLAEQDVELVAIDFSPFAEAAKLLYEGPWVAERYLAVRELIDSKPESLLPVINQIVSPGKHITAAQVFSAQYRLMELKRQAEAELEKADAIVTPTNGTIYTLEEIEAEAIQLNSNLGYYTNFMNLLDCAAVAVPASFYANGVGFGVTLFHQALSDKRLLSIATLLHCDVENLRMSKSPYRRIPIVVCGAHMEGLPLNWQLVERGAVLESKTRTSGRYRLYALVGGPPNRPGLKRDENAGEKIAVEVWSVPLENVGSLVAEIPPPLGIGKLELEDGTWESGFICEPCGLETATDITETGSWRNYLKTM